MRAIGVALFGASTGLQYGLLAVGLVLVFRAGRYVNFAQAQIGVIGAVLLARLHLQADLPYPVALIVGIAVVALLAAAIERTVIQKLFDASRLVLLVATIAVTEIVFGLTQFNGLHIGSVRVLPRSPLVLDTAMVSSRGGFPLPFRGQWEVGGVVLDSAQVVTLLVGPIIAAGFYLFFARTAAGRAIRAASSNPEAARLAGISVRRVSLLVWITAGVLSALAAVLAAPSQPAVYVGVQGPELLLRGLAAAMLAGFVDFRIAFVGGVVVGVLEQAAKYNFQTPGISDLTVVAVLLVGVLWRGRALAQLARRGEDVLHTESSRQPVPARLQVVAVARHLDRLGWVALAVVLAALPLVPALATEAKAQALIQLLSFAIVGLSLTVLTGWAGQVSLGHFALLGVGAFVAAQTLGDHGWGIPAVLLVAGLATAVTALVIGLPALRFRGMFLAATTLGLAALGPSWLFRQRFLGVDSSGTGRISLEQLTLPFGFDITSYRSLYYVTLGLLLLVAASTRALRTSGIGRALIAVRDNERAARAAGISPVGAKVMALAVSGFIAGLGGAMWGMSNSTFSYQSFEAHQSLVILSMVIVGGLGSLVGPIAGAFAVFGWPYLVPGQNTAVIRALFSGGLLLNVLLFFPGGISSLLERARRWTFAFLQRSVPERPFEVDHDAPPLVVENVSVSFGGVHALRGVDLRVDPGEIVGVIGGNGAGKTTLLNCISGHVTPQTGRIKAFGEQVAELPAHFRPELGVYRSFQDATLYAGLTVLETVKVALDYGDHSGTIGSLLGAPWVRAAEASKSAVAMDALHIVGLDDRAHVLTSELSTGMRRLVDVASAIAAKPRLLLLDEPTAGLAQREVEEFGPRLRHVRDELGCAMVLVEHDIPLVMSLSDRVYCLDAGAVLAEGRPEEVRDDPAVVRSYLSAHETVIARSGPSKRRRDRALVACAEWDTSSLIEEEGTR